MPQQMDLGRFHWKTGKTFDVLSFVSLEENHVGLSDGYKTRCCSLMRDEGSVFTGISLSLVFPLNCSFSGFHFMEEPEHFMQNRKNCVSSIKNGMTHSSLCLPSSFPSPAANVIVEYSGCFSCSFRVDCTMSC